MARIITTHVTPRSREEKLVWLDEDTVKVWVRVAPEKGRANEAVIALLAKELGVAKTSISLVRGSTTRMKQFSLS